MNEIGVALAYSIVQVTLVALLAGMVYAIARRIAPASGSVVPLTTLLMVTVISIAAFVPWPGWADWVPNRETNASAVPHRAASRAAIATAVGPPETPSANEALSESSGMDGPAHDAVSSPRWDALSRFWHAFSDELSRARPSDAPSPPRWPAAVAIVFCISMALGLLRLCVGLLSISSYRRNSRAVDDAELLRLVDSLGSELRCRRKIEVRESEKLSTAATIGWRRPLILLPAGYGAWSLEQRRAVLAHEIAHIASNHFVSVVAAQIAVVLHFYHPLVHWLAGRLRLEQELAADAMAAEAAGGRSPYLQALAVLALRQPDQRMSWATRTFLPTRTTFLRRIEMLRSRTKLATRAPLAMRAATVGLLLLAGLAVAGIRGPAARIGNNSVAESPANVAGLADRSATDQLSSALAANADAGPGQSDHGDGLANDPFGVSSSAYRPTAVQYVADERGDERLRPESDPFSPSLVPPLGVEVEALLIELSYIPADAVAVAVIRPRVLLNQRGFESLKAHWQKEKGRNAFFAVPWDELEQVTLIVLRPFGVGLVIRANAPNNFAELEKALVANPVEATILGHQYIKPSGSGAGNGCYFGADDRTLIVGDEQTLQRLILSGKSNQSRLVQGDQWKKVERSHAAAVADVEWARTYLGLVRAGGSDLQWSAVSPLWESTQRLYAGARLDNALVIELTATCANEAAATRVKETLSATITLARNALDSLRNQTGGAPTPNTKVTEMSVLLTLFNAGEQLLNSVTLAQKENVVEVKASTQMEAGTLLGLLATQVSPFNIEAAHQQTARNNLKQLGLAMHNYRDAHGHFPPAVALGPDGKTPHSWRVELLPFVEQAKLYNDYRMNEPWDSQHNREILRQIPAVFRHPDDRADSTNASFFVLTGAGAIFGSTPLSIRDGAGPRIQDIQDGTSNTLLIVEAKRDIPWTKPEDIPFDTDPATQLPKLGGYSPDGFNVAFADGAVRHLPAETDEQTLRALITKAAHRPETAAREFIKNLER